MDTENAIVKVEIKGVHYFVEKSSDGIRFYLIGKEVLKMDNSEWETLKGKLNCSNYCKLRNVFMLAKFDE